MTAEVVIQLPG